MDWSICPHSPQYTPQLRRLYLESRQQAFTWLPLNSFDLLDFDEVITGEEVLVALHQGYAVGFIAWWPPSSFIHSLFIAPAFHRKGIGQALLYACLAKVGRPATLKCLTANTAALAFYRSVGWTIASRGNSAAGAYYLLAFNK